MKYLRQCIGIDCSMDEMVVCLAQLNDDMEVRVKATRNFGNNLAAFKSLLKWAASQAEKGVPLVYAVEATGVYHQKMACYLVDAGQSISVLLPNKVSHFAHTMNDRTVTDKSSARVIATMGVLKKLDPWQKPDPLFAFLKELTRERERLLAEAASIKCQRHAAKHGAFASQDSIKRMNQRLRLIEKQTEQIEKELRQAVALRPELKQRLDKVCTTPGLGFLTVVTVIAETNGFNLVRNKKQLVSYSGYDVVSKQSGISVKTKGRISHRGNRHIRRALHFPAITAVKHDAGLQTFYDRLFSRHGIKMKAYTAVQRKLLSLIYSLWNKHQAFDPNYSSARSKNLGQPAGAALTELALGRSQLITS